MAVELKVPAAGESITEVQVGEWRKAEGDPVAQDEILLEIETDKAAMELPSPAAGVLGRVLKKQGEFAKVGEVLALIEPAGAAAADEPAGLSRRSHTESSAAAKTSGQDARPPADTAQPGGQDGRPPADAATSGGQDAPAKPETPRVMPAARRALAEAGLAVAEVAPSGPGGRLLKEDVQRHAEQAKAPAAPATGAEDRAGVNGGAGKPPEQAGVADAESGEETVPMTMLRRRVAQRLVEAQHTAALLTTFNEVDMSAVMALRAEHQDSFQKRYGIKLGFMSFFVKAAIEGLKQFPAINAETRGTDIIYKNYYDIGVAVSTDKGLVVPVLRNTERMSFAQVEQAIADLAARGRENKLTLSDLEGGTFTITNGGVFGSMLSTPIINPPQSGILSLHAITDRPVAREGQVVIRPMMYAALSYDHRIVDGREAVSFLKRIKECVEAPARMLIEA